MNHQEDVLNVYRKLNNDLKVVGIVGAGRIGAWTALYLEKLGITKFILVDKDVVDESNIKDGETPYSFFDLDSYKVTALKKCLYENKDVRLIRHKTWISNQIALTELRRILNCQLVVLAADTEAANEITQNAELMRGKFMVIPGMHSKTGGGEVTIWLPSVSPCPMHSMGMSSFSQLIEPRASEANIDVNDVHIVAKYTAEIVRYMLFKDYASFFKPRGSVLHLIKLKDGRYRKLWFTPEPDRNCELCQLAITFNKLFS